MIKNRMNHMFCCFSAMLVCISISLSWVLAGCGSQKNTSSPTLPASAVSQKNQKNLLAEVIKTNSWQEGDQNAYQYSVSLENHTNQALDTWQIVIDAQTDVTVKDFWNCTLAADGTMLTFTPAEYNQKIDAGKNVSDLGFIVLADQSLSLEGKYAVDPADGMTEKLTQHEAVSQDAEKTESTTIENQTAHPAGTPLAIHGAVSVKGADLVDEHGNPFQLKGVSTHGLAWYPQFVSKSSFQKLRDDWGANLVRLALYTDENGGWCTDGDRTSLENTIDTGVQAAADLGMYVIIDWHVLHDLTPMKYQSDAEQFFDRMSAKYADYDNVIYEICNEPNGGTSWQEVKSYAEDIIPVIRSHDADALILVGTPNWSQDIHAAAQDPILDGGNLMYTMHFYAATHKDDLRQQMVSAHQNGMPIFISEFSIVDASGNGAIDNDSAEKWKDAINDLHISYAAWSICNKDESSALLQPSASADNWTEDDLSDTGIWIRNMIQGK